MRSSTRARSSLVRDPGDAVLAATSDFNAPGHCPLVVDDEGTTWIVHHAMNRREGSGPRFLMIDAIDWSSGWPVVTSGRGPSSTSSSVPVIGSGG